MSKRFRLLLPHLADFDCGEAVFGGNLLGGKKKKIPQEEKKVRLKFVFAYPFQVCKKVKDGNTQSRFISYIYVTKNAYSKSRSWNIPLKWFPSFQQFTTCLNFTCHFLQIAVCYQSC